MYNRIGIILFLSTGMQLSCHTTEQDWSPDHAEILFTSNISGNSEIYIASAGDTSWKRLTDNPAGNNWPVGSPAGDKIVFQSRRTGNLDIWIMNADGSDLKQLTHHQDHDYLPGFTPGGSEIVFTSWRKQSDDEEKTTHLYIMNLDGSEQRRLLSDALNTSAGASFHPSGKTFLFSRRIDKGADIFEANRDGIILRQLTNDTLYNGSAEFSPDGSKIAFYQDDGKISKIVVMDSDGSNQRVLTDNEKDYYPHWSPDGRWIIYSRVIPETEDRDVGLYAIRFTGGDGPVKLIDRPSREAEGRWRTKHK